MLANEFWYPQSALQERCDFYVPDDRSPVTAMCLLSELVLDCRAFGKPEPWSRHFITVLGIADSVARTSTRPHSSKSGLRLSSPKDFLAVALAFAGTSVSF